MTLSEGKERSCILFQQIGFAKFISEIETGKSLLKDLFIPLCVCFEQTNLHNIIWKAKPKCFVEA